MIIIAATTFVAFLLAVRYSVSNRTAVSQTVVRGSSETVSIPLPGFSSVIFSNGYAHVAIDSDCGGIHITASDTVLQPRLEIPKEFEPYVGYAIDGDELRITFSTDSTERSENSFLDMESSVAVRLTVPAMPRKIALTDVYSNVTLSGESTDSITVCPYAGVVFDNARLATVRIDHDETYQSTIITLSGNSSVGCLTASESFFRLDLCTDTTSRLGRVEWHGTANCELSLDSAAVVGQFRFIPEEKDARISITSPDGIETGLLHSY